MFNKITVCFSHIYKLGSVEKCYQKDKQITHYKNNNFYLQGNILEILF